MLSIIVAIALNNVIGKDGKLIWHLPTDLKRFKEITDGHTMIMGRKTFESLPGVLKGRKHVVLTSNTNYKVDHPDVEIIHSIDDIQKFVYTEEEFFVIGGGELYKKLLPFSDKLFITWVDKEFDGDTYFEEIPSGEFELIHEEDAIDEKSGIKINFANYERMEPVWTSRDLNRY